MKKTVDYNEDRNLYEVREKLDNNLEKFKKKFILFFIGLVGFALSVVVYAFGAGGWGSLPMLALVVTWCGPLVLKFWTSGFGSLFDFQYSEYEIDEYGNKRDVTKIDSVLTGPFLKCVAALIVALVALYLVPAEMVVRLINHMRYERKLGEKGSINESPRREALLTVIVIVAMIVIGAIGGAIASIRENTSDMGNDEVATIVETLQTEAKRYTINSLYNYNTGSSKACATVTQVGDTVTFISTTELTYYYGGNSYTLPAGSYTYVNGAWINVDENAAIVLSAYTIGLAFDLEYMKNNPNAFVINVEKDVMGGRIDKETHECYQLRAKDNSELQFENFYIEKDFTFAAWSGQNYIFVFDN